MPNTAVGKEDWVALFQDIGLSKPDMERWHRLFEERHPDGHQAFLEWIQLPEEEIRSVRDRFAASK